MKGVVEENSSHYCCNLLFLFRLSCRDVAVVSVMAWIGATADGERESVVGKCRVTVHDECLPVCLLWL
jgi:hypothetical protein